jgi:DNA-binding XRE family transcriptional regulator
LLNLGTFKTVLMKDEINKSEICIRVTLKISDIGKRIKVERTKQKLTQQDLAFYCFADKCLISELERGISNNMTLFTLFKIATVLGITEDYLFTGANN